MNNEKKMLTCAFAVFCVAIMAATALVCLTTDAAAASTSDADDDIGVKESTGECYDDQQVNGEKFWSGCLQYKVWTDKNGKDHVQVHDYRARYRNIVVPDTIEHNGRTYTVNEIYNWGLSSAAITARFPHSVSIGPAIERIGDHAMDLEASLSRKGQMVHFEIRDLEHSQLKTIGKYAFRAHQYESIELPRSLVKIDGNAFDRCDDLKEVKLNSDRVELIGETFGCCYNLEKINLEHVTSIGQFCFYHSHIKELNLSSACVINEYALGSGAEHITFSNDLSYIGNFNFSSNFFVDAMGNPIHVSHENLRGHEFVKGADGKMHMVA